MRQPSNASGEFSISSISSISSTGRRQPFLIARIKFSVRRFISPGVCPPARCYTFESLSNIHSPSILPAVLHLSRCNAIPSKINEARSRCFFRTGASHKIRMHWNMFVGVTQTKSLYINCDRRITLAASVIYFKSLPFIELFNAIRSLSSSRSAVW